jgi:hypothetical protein
MEYHYFGVSEIADTNPPAIKLAGKAMGTHGRILWQQYIRSMGKTAVSKGLMHCCSPIIEFRLNCDDRIIKRVCDNVSPAALIVELLGNPHDAPW